MKLIRFGESRDEKPGVCIDSKFYDVSDFVDDYDEYFFENEGLKLLADKIANHPNSFPDVDATVRLAAPISRPSKIICVGMNYFDHCIEMGEPVPSEPIIFFKATSALNGPFDPVVIPKDSAKTDWEVELAIVIGKRTCFVSEAAAMDSVAGYMMLNDVSEREYQLERGGGQWDKGKSFDTFAPMGPYLVTKDEIPDHSNLDLWMKINGRTMQASNTKHMLFTIPQLIAYISRFMTLLPGDVISTGTPEGIAYGMPHPMYLKNGDVMEMGITGLGVARQICMSHDMNLSEKLLQGIFNGA